MSLEVPEVSDLDIQLGEITYMPLYENVPGEFKRTQNPYVQLVTKWFFSGLTDSDVARLKPKDGIDKKQALRAVKAVIGSMKPKHEHKEAACADMLSEWFDLADIHDVEPKIVQD